MPTVLRGLKIDISPYLYLFGRSTKIAHEYGSCLAENWPSPYPNSKHVLHMGFNDHTSIAFSPETSI